MNFFICKYLICVYVLQHRLVNKFAGKWRSTVPKKDSPKKEVQMNKKGKYPEKFIHKSSSKEKERVKELEEVLDVYNVYVCIHVYICQ
jgi:hypothetical protein